MTIETFKVVTSGQVLVFVSTSKPERLEVLDRALRGAGARSFGPQAFVFPQKATTTAVALAEKLGDLETGECVYVLTSDSCQVLLRPRETGGITVKPP